MSTASARAATVRPTVEVTRDQETYTAAKGLAGRGVMELTWPPMLAHVHVGRIGMEQAIAANAGVLPGSPQGNGWLVEQAREHGVTLIAFSGYLVRYLVERGVILEALMDSLGYVASETGASVLLLDETVPTLPPAPPVTPPRHGETVVGPFQVGRARPVPPGELSGLSHVVAPLGRDVTTVSFAPPDRFIAQWRASHQYAEHRTTGIQLQPPAEWLEHVIRSFEPRLLIIDRETVEWASVDVKAFAKSHHLAIGVI